MMGENLRIGVRHPVEPARVDFSLRERDDGGVDVVAHAGDVDIRLALFRVEGGRIRMYRVAVMPAPWNEIIATDSAGRIEIR